MQKGLAKSTRCHNQVHHICQGVLLYSIFVTHSLADEASRGALHSAPLMIPSVSCRALAAKATSCVSSEDTCIYAPINSTQPCRLYVHMRLPFMLLRW